MEYDHKHFGNLRPSSREIHFTYIPGDAEIVSIDAFNKSNYGNGVVIGITFIKYVDSKRNQFLNIYSDWEPGSEFNLDSIAQSCLSLDLQFTPYQLYHTDMVIGDTKEVVWLLSGSDLKVHLFREDRALHLFNEQPVEEYFPEFEDLPSPVHWMDIRYFEDQRKRLTAVGCQNGFVKLCCIDVGKKEILQKWEVLHDGPVTSLRIFSLKTSIECPLQLIPTVESDTASDYESDTDPNDRQQLHLLVANAVESSVVYSNVLSQGLSEKQVLSGSDAFDCVLSTWVADLDFDGQNELLLGTYGQVGDNENGYVRDGLIPHPRGAAASSAGSRARGTARAPGRHSRGPGRAGTASAAGRAPKRRAGGAQRGAGGTARRTPAGTSPGAPNPAPRPVRASDDPRRSVTDGRARASPPATSAVAWLSAGELACRAAPGRYELAYQRSFPDPLVALLYLDITNDSLCELMVASLRGLHVLQHNLQDVAKLCKGRLKAVVDNLPSEDAFHALLLESL
ncbi:PREDICTED: kaptin-like [Priapulus caudatus]|uniref:Kaptin-like n=1 Tax=Priapulus caudatus TaxID=37621 RepID=A0ABM1EHX4_PRICU|nr:PREDICTED: kaptin-like [Priapulus caudatus]